MSSVRTVNFSTSNPERKPYFHYAVYADQVVSYPNNVPTGGCGAGGIGDLLGSNLIVGNGTTCGPFLTADQERGATMHELGHNLNLVHNQNDAPSKKYSQIHASVMNYRFAYSG